MNDQKKYSDAMKERLRSKNYSITINELTNRVYELSKENRQLRLSRDKILTQLSIIISEEADEQVEELSKKLALVMEDNRAIELSRRALVGIVEAREARIANQRKSLDSLHARARQLRETNKALIITLAKYQHNLKLVLELAEIR